MYVEVGVEDLTRCLYIFNQHQDSMIALFPIQVLSDQLSISLLFVTAFFGRLPTVSLDYRYLFILLNFRYLVMLSNNFKYILMPYKVIYIHMGWLLTIYICLNM